MANKISDEAVLKSTGKTWKEWFVILNKAGAKKMEHKEIAQWLKDNHIKSGWWSQMVTVQYEQDVKGRKKHEKPEGYQISKSMTLSFPVSKVYTAVNNLSIRNNWLKDSDFKITTANKNKAIRGKWIDGKTNIEFQFYQKDNNKTQIVVQQSKIITANQAEKMKKYWSKNFTNLKSFLEK
jgi:Domain of unknown function (DUF4287)